MIKKILTSAFVLTVMTCSAAFADISNQAKMQYNQGLEYYNTGQYEKAIQSFKNAISLDADYIDAYYNLGVILQQTNKDAEALNVFKQIIVRNPSDYDAVYNAASLSTKLGQIDNAKKYLSLIPYSSSLSNKARALASSIKAKEDEAAAKRAEAEAARMAEEASMRVAEAQKAEEAAKKVEAEALAQAQRYQQQAEETKRAIQQQTEKYQSMAQQMGSRYVIAQSNETYENLPSPTGITTDADGNIYVASFSNNSITKITPSGAKTDFVKNATLNGPIDIEADDNGNIYVANYNTDNIVKITPSGEISQLLGNVKKPYCLHIRDGVLFISSQGSNNVIKYKL